MFSILDDRDTTPEQVRQAVRDGLIHPISAAEWLATKTRLSVRSKDFVLRAGPRLRIGLRATIVAAIRAIQGKRSN